MDMIKFGTSGWRGIIAEDFTYANVAIVTQAISNFINEKYRKTSASIIIGYNTGFMSKDFARTAAEVLAGNGIKVLFCNRDTPTPVIANDIIYSKLTCGINFTASHNSYKHNGLKYSPSSGGHALPKTTKKIEKYSALIQSKDIKSMAFEYAVKNKLIKLHSPRTAYIKKIKELVNFQALKKSKIRIAIDILYGTAVGYLDALLDDAGICNTTIHKKRDTMFAVDAPDPSEKKSYGSFAFG
jgi:phosphomannomutase